MAKWIATQNHVDNHNRYWRKKQIVEVAEGQQPPGLCDDQGKYLGKFVRMGEFKDTDNKMLPGNPHAKITPILEDLTTKDLRQKAKNMGLPIDGSRSTLISRIRSKMIMTPSSAAMQSAAMADRGGKG